jgi:hypothetical protein
MMLLGLEGMIVATIGVGFAADQFGLGTTLSWSMILSALSIPFILAMPETRRRGRAGR